MITKEKVATWKEMEIVATIAVRTEARAVMVKATVATIAEATTATRRRIAAVSSTEKNASVVRVTEMETSVEK